MTITADAVRAAVCNMDLVGLLEHARQCSSIQSDVRRIWPNIYKILKRVVTSCPDYMRYSYSQMDNIAEMYYAGVRRELVNIPTTSYLRAIPGDLRRIIYNCCTLCTVNNNSTMYEFASLMLDWNLPASITSWRFDRTVVYSWSACRIVYKQNLYKFVTPDPRDEQIYINSAYTENELAQNHTTLYASMVNARQILADRGYVLE